MEQSMEIDRSMNPTVLIQERSLNIRDFKINVEGVETFLKDTLQRHSRHVFIPDTLARYLNTISYVFFLKCVI